MRSLLTVLVGTVMLTAGFAGTAGADRCEATELVVRPLLDSGYEEPVDERDSPVCYALLNYGYYYLCPDGSQGLACFTSPQPDPTRPFPGLEDYHPEPGRIACGVIEFVTRQLPGYILVCYLDEFPIWRDDT